MAFEEEPPESRESHPLEVVAAAPSRVRPPSVAPVGVTRFAKRLRARATDALLVAFGVAASLTGFVAVRRAEDSRLQAEFERESRRAFDRVRSELVASTEVVAGYAGHLAVDPDEGCRSRAYARGALVRHPSLRGLSWNTVVPREGRAAFEAAMQGARPGFAITERRPDGSLVRAGDRDRFVVVTCMEPEAGNEKAIGFDLASEPTRAEAIARTFASRAPAATARIRLVQETANAAGVLLIQAVTEARSGAVVGSVSAVLRIDDVFARTLGEVPRGVRFSLVDRGSAEETPLFAYGGDEAKGGVRVELPVNVADRPWVLRASIPAEALRDRRSAQPWAWLASASRAASR